MKPSSRKCDACDAENIGFQNRCIQCNKKLGKNKFGKEVKYVKWYYYYDNTKKFKVSDRTYTYNTDKARTFWSEKIKEGFIKV